VRPSAFLEQPYESAILNLSLKGRTMNMKAIAVLNGLRDEDRDWFAGMGGTLL
jgi:hypothetical protein